MELKWLEDLIAVAEWGSFSKAAGARHTTQPALSRRIKSLEAWFASPLVDRRTYPVHLTDAGAELLGIARQFVPQVLQARRRSRLAARLGTGTLTVAMPHALAVTFFPKWWQGRQWPDNLYPEVIAADLEACVGMMKTGACSLLLCYTHPDVPNELLGTGIEHELLARDELVPVSAVDPDGAPKFTLQQRSDEDRGGGIAAPLLAYPASSFLGRAMRGALGSGPLRLPLRTTFESALVEALKSAVVAGLGIAWLPRSIVDAELRARQLVVVDGAPTVPLEICLFSAAGRVASARRAGS